MDVERRVVAGGHALVVHGPLLYHAFANPHLRPILGERVTARVPVAVSVAARLPSVRRVLGRVSVNLHKFACSPWHVSAVAEQIVARDAANVGEIRAHGYVHSARTFVQLALAAPLNSAVRPLLATLRVTYN